MKVKTLLSSFLFFTFLALPGVSQQSQPLSKQKKNKTNSLFIDEKVLTEYTTLKEMTELRKKIVNEKGDRTKNLYQLAGKLIAYGSGKSPQESKFYLDSASSCIKIAGKTDNKKFKNTAYLVESRYAEFYKGQGDYSKSLYHYQNALTKSKKGKPDFNLHFEVAGLFMLLNNQNEFGITLNLIRSLSSKKSYPIWNIDLLERMLLYSHQDSLEAIAIGQSTIVGTANKALLTRNQSKQVELKEKKRREGFLTMLENSNYLSVQNMSRWYMATKQYDSALKYLKIANANRGFNTSFSSRQSSLLLDNQNSDSIKYNDQRANVNYNIAKILEIKNQLDSASKYYDQYLKYDQWKLEYHYETARFFAFVNKDIPKAISTFKQGIDLSRTFIKNVESLPFSEKKLFIESQKKYLDYFTSFVKENINRHPELSGDLYDLLLTTKAVQLTSSLRMTNFVTNSKDTTVQSQYELLKSKRNELARVQEGAIEYITKLKSEITEIERALYAKSEVLNAIDNGDISWKMVLNRLAANESAIELLRFNNILIKQGEYMALIMRGERSDYPELVSLGDANFLENRAYRYYSNAITAGITDTLSYKSFWSSLASKIIGSKKIYLAQDGVYYKINLNTLFDPRSKQYILDQFNVETILSTRELVSRGEESTQGPQSAILFGSPNFEGTMDTPEPVEFSKTGINLPGQTRSMSFSYLFGAKKEVTTIDGFLKSSGINVKTYLDNSASEDNLKRISKPDVLHIATHGFFFEPGNSQSNPFQQKFNNPDPMFNTGLLFAGVANPGMKGEEDGILTAFEAATIDLSTTKLVVLSACETGAGEVQNGEGVFGLQRSFKMAGAQHLLMSLWKVDDEVTQKLMTQFYSYWIAGMNIRTAFYMAQLNVKKENPSPYFWGAFILL